MLQLSQCKLSWQEDSFSKLQKKAAKLLGISVEDFTQFTIVKRSLDARKKPNLFVLYTVRFSCRRESEVLKRNRKNKNLTIAQKEPSLWRQIEEIKNPERYLCVGLCLWRFDILYMYANFYVGGDDTVRIGVERVPRTYNRRKISYKCSGVERRRIIY